MANSSCKNCGCSKIDCGCKDSFLTSPAPCPTPDDCPEAQPCSEVFDADCVIYTGDTILCGQDVVVEPNTTMADALHAIVDYFCQYTPPPPPPPVYSYICNGTTCLQVVGTGGPYATLAQCEAACPPPPVVTYDCNNGNCVEVQGSCGEFATLAACQAACQSVVTYNCVDCNCVQVQGSGGQYDTLQECEAACQFSSPCGVSTSCEDLKLCIPCEGCLNPLQYIFNLSLTSSCNPESCYCVGITSLPAAVDDVTPGYEPFAVYDGSFYYKISFTTAPTQFYYLWYSNTDGKWYLTSAVGNKTNIFAELVGQGACPIGTYTSLASPITEFVVGECELGPLP